VGESVRKKVLALIIALMILLPYRAESPAQVYKYVDKDGVPHYTNAPTDPRYKPKSGHVKRKPAPAKSKRSKPGKYSKSSSSKIGQQANQPPLSQQQ
jgi:hypothetical protein